MCIGQPHIHPTANVISDLECVVGFYDSREAGCELEAFSQARANYRNLEFGFLM
jgi:hypothetical protein